jgi:3-hydroxybutyryl-CoA dehydrogenase
MSRSKRLKTNKKKTPKISKRTGKPLKAHLQSAEPSMPRGQAKRAPVCIYLAGESPMVEQFAEVCSAHGYDVFVSWNEIPAQKPEFSTQNINVTHTIPANTSVFIELTNIDIPAKKKNLERFDAASAMHVPIISSSITVTATEQSSWISGKHRLVGLAALPMLIQKPLVEIAPTVYSPKETLEVTKLFFQSNGKEIEIVQDRIGMVLPRMLCRIINEAAFAITEDIASPQDIDTALKLGVNFPLGPFELAEQIGLKQVYAVLTALYTDVQEERYRISPLLKQLAMTRV